MALLAHSSKAEATFPCEPSLIFELLTDYDSYLEWVPQVTQSKLLAKEGDLALAELEVRPPQPGKLVFECIHDKNRSVLGRAISGALPFGKFEWTIAATEANQSQVTLVLEGKPDWHWLLPAYHKLLQAPAYMSALQGQVQAYSSELVIPAEGGETILDLMETSEGMVLIYRGRKYSLQPIPQRQ